MKENVYVVIMAGGVGQRFWPLSRESRPKQFLDILGVGKSFLRQTYERFLPLVAPENILVVTGEAYRDLVVEQIPELAPDQILGEPLGRNTAPCIAYAAFRLRAVAPDSVMIVTPADHFITGEEEFRRAISDGVEFAASRDAMVTIGITPTRPDTGYGYIQIDSGLAAAGDSGLTAADGGSVSGAADSQGTIIRVKTFTEKPSVDVARQFVESGEFVWNSGLFIWRTETILRALSCHLGEVYSVFDAAREAFGTATECATVRAIYPETRNISIDFGVIEKADNVYVRRSNFGWSDVGTWNSLYGLSPQDERGNALSGDVRATGSSGSLVRVPEGKLAVVGGLADYVVVDTPDVLLVWPRSREQDIKQIVTTLRFDGHEEFL